MLALDDWDFVVVMPSVALPAAVEAGHTAIIPHGDARYQHILATRPASRRFLEAFRTAFGKPLQPSIVVRDRSVPKIMAEDLMALRNIVALAAVVKARTDRCVHRFGGFGPVYSDLFEVYPVNLAVDREMVVVQTASESGLDDDLTRFQGQPHPAYIYPENVRPELDETLLRSLLQLWQSGGANETFRRSMFRSLEMAYHALAAPFHHMGSEQDHALALSLWVSAFETLASRDERVRADDVEEMILAIQWLGDELRSDLVESTRGPRPGRPVTRPVQAYERLYKVRNESLHGDAISKSLVAARRAESKEDELLNSPLRADEWNHLAVAAPALYRGVLLLLLTREGFHEYPQEPVEEDWTRYGEYLAARDRYEHFEKPLAFRCRGRG